MYVRCMYYTYTCRFSRVGSVREEISLIHLSLVLHVSVSRIIELTYSARHTPVDVEDILPRGSDRSQYVATDANHRIIRTSVARKMADS